MRLDAVQDIEQLRQAAKILERENEQLTKKIIQLNRELNQLKGGDPEQLKLKIAELERQLAM